MLLSRAFLTRIKKRKKKEADEYSRRAIRLRFFTILEAVSTALRSLVSAGPKIS